MTHSTKAEGARGRQRCARHLSPVDLKERTGKPGPDVHKGDSRCSNKGFLSMASTEILESAGLDGSASCGGQVRSNAEARGPVDAAVGAEQSNLVFSGERLRSLVQRGGGTTSAD